MGPAWQQGPLASGAIGRFLVPDPLPGRLLYAEPLRLRMRVRFAGAWIADSEDVMLLHEPGHYPVAYFPLGAITDGVLEPSEHATRHQDLGPTSWYTARVGEHSKPSAAWQHTELPGYASELKGRVAFAWRALDAFYEEEERDPARPRPRPHHRRGRPRQAAMTGIDTTARRGASTDLMMAYLSMSVVRADAVFVSGLRRRDEPSAGQVRQAVAAAIRAFGCSGCAGRVAQEFGDHPETAVIRMRWARAVAREAFADPAPEPGPGADAARWLVIRPRLPAEQASGPLEAGRREPARSAAAGEG